MIHHRKCVIHFLPLFLYFSWPARPQPLLSETMIPISPVFVHISPSKGMDVSAVNFPSSLTSSAADVLDVRGFDVTGVTTQIDLTFPEIQDECDCIKACLDRKATCNNYVWKFSTPASVESGHRTCTLCTLSSLFL